MMTEGDSERVAAIEAAIGRLSCELVLTPDAWTDMAWRGQLADLRAQLVALPDPGGRALAVCADAVIEATSGAAVHTALGVLVSSLSSWREYAPAPAPLARAAAPVDEGDADLVVLRTDPELASMFIAEALEHLGTIEASLLQLETSPGDQQILNDIFRPFHTIKGNAGALGVGAVQQLAHTVESLLDRARAGRLAVGAAEIDAVLEAVDLLTAMISDLGLRLAGAPRRDFSAAGQALIAAIDALASNGGRREQGSVEPPAALEEVQEPRRRADDQPGHHAVKVDTRKLDTLIDMVGELVVAQSLLYGDPSWQARADERATRNLAQLRRITGDLQRTAMSMRMVPIRATFQKMARLVRDLGQKAGKPVELVCSGEDTELDRKVVEEITDPLMHMIRNSIDHGIEPADARERKGKPRVGCVRLTAAHQAGSIAISVADDGQGLQLSRIRATAVSRGLVPDGADLTSAEIHQLIFKPGFSTATEVTQISGRGVGMDVVRRNIETLRGRVDITSTPGEGTTFLIKLPLTLAIVEGLLVAVARERYVIPTFAVRESLRPVREQIHHVQGCARLLQVRDALLPMVRLSDLFGIACGHREPWDMTAVVIEDDGRSVALLVDDLLGKQEVVIKSLGDTFKHVRGVAGGAILGDGHVGLILDAGGMMGLAAA